MQNKPCVTNVLFCFLTLLALTGCALSPQTVSIRPDLTASEKATGRSVNVSLEVRDKRQTNIIGYRGGVYDTAAIATADGMTRAIYTELERVWPAAGVKIVAPGNTADVSIVLDVERIEYKVRKKKLLWNIDVFMSIKTTVSYGAKTVSTQLQDRLTRDFATAPSTHENEAFVNEVTSRILQRLIEDPALLEMVR